MGFGETIVAVISVLAVFVGFPVSIAHARRLWRLGGAPQPALPPADSARLERIEQGLEAIATEVERISEGQRFTTRLLSESRPGAALPPGSAGDPARLPGDVRRS